MVCEKLAGVAHDFTTDPLDLIIKDGVLSANGTTLGGDNGAAVACMLAILDDDTLTHPAPECVFTTQEEIGLNGAEALDKSLLSARTMINLDSEDEELPQSAVQEDFVSLSPVQSPAVKKKDAAPSGGDRTSGRTFRNRYQQRTSECQSVDGSYDQSSVPQYRCPFS